MIEKDFFAMNKGELVASVSKKAEMTRVDAEKVIDAVFESITEALKSGDEVRLIGFGIFATAERAATEGRNPKTGEKIDIAAHRIPKFKPGKQLRDAVY